jgi:cellulose biosynthesis protein BcsQ
MSGSFVPISNISNSFTTRKGKFIPMARKVIIVAPKVVSDFLADEYVDWDAQIPCETIADMWNGLNTGELSDESDVVLIIDTLFHDTPEEFIEAVATFAPEALVMVLSYTNEDEIIRARVEEFAQDKGLQEAPFHFIRSEVALQEIEETIYQHDHADELLAKAVAETSKTVSIKVDSANKVDTSRNGLVITATSPKGGSGKSSVALLVGTTLAKASKKAFEAGLVERPLDVVIVDLDTFDGQLGFVIGQMRPTALNVAMSSTPNDPATIKSNLVYNERMGIHALLAPVRGQTATFTNPTFYRNTIRTLKTMFDVVILDTSVQHYDDLIKTVALPEADAILLVTTLDIKSVKGLARWMNVAIAPLNEGGHGIDIHKVGVVVNGSVHGVGMGSQELVSAALGAPLLVAIPLDTLAVQAAGNANRLEDIVFHPTIGPAYFKLANKIVKSRGIKILPIIEDENNSVAPTAAGDAPVQSKGFFRRKKG